jgi:membrane associated rhomboid family serine protease
MQFGPGPITPAVRAIVFINVGVFILEFFAARPIINLFGLTPEDVLKHGAVWQPFTYLFLHSPAGLSHILFNMLAVWMFGVDLERRWGTRQFVFYYFLTGVGAALATILVSLLPFTSAAGSFNSVTIGASGSVYGLLGAWAVLFPTRQILFMLMFPIQARVYALIMGAIAFYSALGTSGSNVANVAHLGGLIVGLIYLKGPRNLRMEFQYWLARWRMDRARRKFGVHQGGKDKWVH